MTNLEADPVEVDGAATDCYGPEFLVLQPRTVPLGGIRALPVSRTLPHREISLIGAWCFLDSFQSDGKSPMEVLPHPHTALQTVTWPFSGTIRHRDSLGSDLTVKPGELNLMTAGAGVSHSEFSSPGQPLSGVQLWVALPDGPDLGPALFENVSDLPVLEGEGWKATVFVGELGAAISPATIFTPLVGAEILMEPGATAELPLNPAWEHGVLAASGSVSLGEPVQEYIRDRAKPDGPSLSTSEQARGTLHSEHLAYLGLKREALTLTAGDEGARIILIGGEPFTEPVVMFWNFIGRNHEQIADAAGAWASEWQDEAEPLGELEHARFGLVPGHGRDHIPGPSIPPVRMQPRRSKHTGGSSK